MSSIGQRGSVGQKVSIAGFLDRARHLGVVTLYLDSRQLQVKGRDGYPLTDETDIFYGGNRHISVDGKRQISGGQTRICSVKRLIWRADRFLEAETDIC